MLKALAHIVIVVALTVLTQLGGVAWLIGLCFKRSTLAALLAYVALSSGTLWLAPTLGRTPLPCLSGDALRMQSPLFCALNRQYVTPELKGVLTDYAAHMQRSFPGTQTRILDANFPYFTGFPLLPHLSHHDGRKVDLAFYYADDTGYLPAKARSPIGYFAFEQGPTDCPKVALTLRWDMGWVQPLWPDLRVEPARMRAALGWLARDARVGKLFIEPHLKARFDAQSPKIRFQGCRAARHDDHIHIQL